MTHERDLLARAVEHAATYLDGLNGRKVRARSTYEEMLAAFNEPLQQGPREPTEVLDQLASKADPGITAMGSGRFFGFVIGGAVPGALAADLLVTAWDQNTGLLFVTPAVAAVEHVAGQWVCDLLGLPQQSTVGFVTGGCMANFTCLAAARHHVLAKAGWDVERDGLQAAPTVRVIASTERHATVDIALHYLGLGSGTVQQVETDGQSRIYLESFRRVLESGEGPTIVSLAAGNVNTGAFDPIAEAIDLAHEHGAWVHIDGAFGLWAAVSQDLRHLVEGVERADSWATDAHKWLNVPYDCGIAIVAQADAHRSAMGAKASYLIQSDADPDPFELVPEFSRRARGVPVWAAMASLGRDGVVDLVDRCCSHARRFADRFSAMDDAEVLNDVVLNQVLVRFRDDDEVTQAVIAGVLEEGTAFMTGTTWKGVAAMRVSVSNWRTTAADVDASVDAVRRVLESIGR